MKHVVRMSAVGASVLVLVASAAACASSGTAQPEQATVAASAAVGAESPAVPEVSPGGPPVDFHSQWAGEAGTTMTVEVTKVTYGPPEGGSTPAVIMMRVENAGGAPGEFASSSFVWESEGGERTEDVSYGGPVDTTLQPGQSAEGAVDVRLPAEGGSLVYELPDGPAFTVKLP